MSHRSSPPTGAPASAGAPHRTLPSLIPPRDAPAGTIESLYDFIDGHRRLLVITGAGVSTASGIPDYRDATGAWKRSPPMTFQQFTGSTAARSRYWARSLVGYSVIGHAQPNAAHDALAALESRDTLELLITQNVDGLHQRAGSRRVVDLHGRIDRVTCLHCGQGTSRDEFQHRLQAANPGHAGLSATTAPDGDADLDTHDLDDFIVPPCTHCGGMLKPDVVFYGEQVPRERVQRCLDATDRADAVLIVGSSLMVYSSLRFVRRAHQRGVPIAALNVGRTRADDLLDFRCALQADEALAGCVSWLPVLEPV